MCNSSISAIADCRGENWCGQLSVGAGFSALFEVCDCSLELFEKSLIHKHVVQDKQVLRS